MLLIFQTALFTLAEVGRYEELLGVISEIETLARSLDDGETEAAASIHRTHILSHRGRLDAAMAEGEKSAARARRIERRHLLIGAAAYLTEARLELAMHRAGTDRAAAGRDLAAAALADSRELGMPIWVERGERALAATR